MTVQLTEILYNPANDTSYDYTFKYEIQGLRNPTCFVINTNSFTHIEQSQKDTLIPFDEFLVYFKRKIKENKSLNF